MAQPLFRFFHVNLSLCSDSIRVTFQVSKPKVSCFYKIKN
ncbi:hypothetical protein J685_1833 [Acinetobacter baumannii 541915]|nr:hypothetical protein J685_1833 [Acinetobacter baumannii 541915]